MSRLKEQAKRLLPLAQHPDHNSAVYISNLPENVSFAEIKQAFSKYGLVAQNPDGSDRITLLRDTNLALLFYHNHDSVPLALEMLNDYTIRPGLLRIAVRIPLPSEIAKESVPKALTPLEMAALHQKVLADSNSWDTSGVKQKYDAIRQRIFQKVTVVENMFRCAELDTDPCLEQDLRDDIAEECARLNIDADIVKISIYKLGGKVTIKFTLPELSAKCISAFNDRFYDGLKIRAYTFDGNE